MTTGEQLDSISTVSNVSALTHLLNPSGGGGSDRLVPYDEIVLDMQSATMDVDISKRSLTLDIQRKEIDADISDRYMTISIQTDNKEVDNGCN